MLDGNNQILRGKQGNESTNYWQAALFFILGHICILNIPGFLVIYNT